MNISTNKVATHVCLSVCTVHAHALTAQNDAVIVQIAQLFQMGGRKYYFTTSDWFSLTSGGRCISEVVKKCFDFLLIFHSSLQNGHIISHGQECTAHSCALENGSDSPCGPWYFGPESYDSIPSIYSICSRKNPILFEVPHGLLAKRTASFVNYTIFLWPYWAKFKKKLKIEVGESK